MNKNIHPSYISELEKLQNINQYRQLRECSNRSGPYISIQGQKYLNLSSNDYLGFAGDNQMQSDFRAAQQDHTDDCYNLSGYSSRLLSGSHLEHHQLEELLASSYDKQSCLLFNNGYMANVGIISSLLERHDIAFIDRSVHASIFDGIRLAKTRFLRYEHLDYDHAEELMQIHRKSYRRAILITESLFSMDGTIVDLARLCEIKNKYDALLYLDEAHALGILGKSGLGLAEQCGLLPDIDIILGTFGKALASIGAFVVLPQILKDCLINKARSFIFTTALPPIMAKWSRMTFSKMRDMEQQRQFLLAMANQLRSLLKEKGYSTLGESQIVPLIIGDNHTTLQFANKFYQKNIYVPAIRPPTVPPDTARLRFSLCANMTWEDLNPLIEILSEQ